MALIAPFQSWSREAKNWLYFHEKNFIFLPSMYLCIFIVHSFSWAWRNFRVSLSDGFQKSYIYTYRASLKILQNAKQTRNRKNIFFVKYRRRQLVILHSFSGRLPTSLFDPDSLAFSCKIPSHHHK